LASAIDCNTRRLLGWRLSRAGQVHSPTLSTAEQDEAQVMRTLKEHCLHRHRFERHLHALRVMLAGFRFTANGAHTKR